MHLIPLWSLFLLLPILVALPSPTQRAPTAVKGDFRRLNEGFERDSRGRAAQLSQQEKATVHDAPYAKGSHVTSEGEGLQKGRSNARRHHARRKRRSAPGEGGDNLDTLRKKASVFQTYYIGSKNRERREKILSGKGTPAEEAHYEEHRVAYNAFRRAIGKGRKNGPVVPKVDPASYTPEQVATLYEKEKLYHRKYHSNAVAKEARDRLRAGVGPPEEVAEFRDVLNGHKEYQRWKHWKNSQVTVDYLPEEQELLEANRDGYLAWRRDYLGSDTKVSKAKELEAGRGSPEEIERYWKLRRQYLTYRKVTQGRESRAGRSPILVRKRDRDVIERLEALRKPRGEFHKEFGPGRTPEWAKLEAGEGDPGRVDRFRRGYEVIKEYSRLYVRIRRKLKAIVLNYDGKNEDDDDDDDDDDESDESGVITLPRESGRPRWHSRLLEILKEQDSKEEKSKTDESPSVRLSSSSVDHHQTTALSTTKTPSESKSLNVISRVTGAFMNAFERGIHSSSRPPTPGGLGPLRSGALANLL